MTSAPAVPPMAHKIKKPRGEWIKSENTNIAETFKRARETQAREAARAVAGWQQ